MDGMNRRSFLVTSSVGTIAGLAGCLDAGSIGLDSDDTARIEVEKAIASNDVDLDASVSRDVSAERPGMVTIELQNVADERRTLWYFSGTSAPFHTERLTHEDGENAVTLFADDEGPLETDGGCWIAGDVPAVRRHATLEADELLTADLALVASDEASSEIAGDEECFSSGTYAGTQSLELFEGDGDLDRASEPATERIGETTLELVLAVSN